MSTGPADSSILSLIELSCSVCLESYAKVDPKTLQCGHSLCKDCLARLVQNGELECPKCRQRAPASSAVASYDLKSVAQVHKEQTGEPKTCSKCKKLSLLSDLWICGDCPPEKGENVLCSLCAMEHEHERKSMQKYVVWLEEKKALSKEALTALKVLVESAKEGLKSQKSAQQEIAEATQELGLVLDGYFLKECSRALDLLDGGVVTAQTRSDITHSIQVSLLAMAQSWDMISETQHTLLGQLREALELVQHFSLTETNDKEDANLIHDWDITLAGTATQQAVILGRGELQTYVPEDPNQNTLLRRASLARLSLECSAAAIGNKLYVVEAYTNYPSVMLDTSTMFWTEIPKPKHHREYASMVVYDKRLFLFGGRDQPYCETLLPVFDESDEDAVVTWKPVAALPETVAKATGVALGDKIYLVGGVGEGGLVDHIQVFEPRVDTWLKETIKLPETVAGRLAAAAYDNCIAVAGDGWLWGVDCSKKCQRYDPRSGCWLSLGIMNKGRCNSLASVNGRLMSLGTHGDNTVEQYDKRMNRWLMATPLILSNDTAAAKAVVIETEA